MIGFVFVIWSNIGLFIKGRRGSAEVFNIAISPRTHYPVKNGSSLDTHTPIVYRACMVCQPALCISTPYQHLP